MDQSKVAVRYAKAFYELCAEQNVLDTARADIQLIERAIENVAEFRLLLEDPIAKPSKKASALEALLKDKVSDATINFVRLIIMNKRDTQLGDIARNFLFRYKTQNGIGEVTLTSAREMEASAIAKLTEIVESSLNIKAEVATKTNPELIGGFVLRVDDVQFDSSIATKLKNIKQSLLN